MTIQFIEKEISTLYVDADLRTRETLGLVVNVQSLALLREGLPV